MLTPDKQALFDAMYAEGQGLYEIKIHTLHALRVLRERAAGDPSAQREVTQAGMIFTSKSSCWQRASPIDAVLGPAAIIVVTPLVDVPKHVSGSLVCRGCFVTSKALRAEIEKDGNLRPLGIIHPSGRA